MTIAPIDRAFPTARRGEIRDLVLETFRYGLRLRLNPQTNALFSETEIQAATAELGRWWSESDAIDLVSMLGAQRGLWLVDQLFPLTASDWWLDNLWGPMVNLPRLPASSGAGEVDWKANAGTTFLGSTTRPDPFAHTLTIGAVRYQVLYTKVTPASGIARLKVRAVETGNATNAKAGAKAVGSNYPSGALAEGITIVADFVGGSPPETTEAYGKRVFDSLRHKSAAGNPPHVREWARQSNVLVEDAFVYSCALNAGTVRVAITQKRNGASGPLARIASSPIVDDARAFLVPPGSPVFPAPPVVVVSGTAPVEQDVIIRFTLPKKSVAGWTDLAPWPACLASRATITTLTNQTTFRMSRADAAALGVGVIPTIMVWHESTSRFERLSIQSISDAGGGLYDVVLAQAPTTAIAIGDTICPDNGHRVAIAVGAETYFDQLGPGQLLPTTSNLYYKAERFPYEDEDAPSTVGSLILSFIRESVGASIIGETLVSPSLASPVVATDPALPPHHLVLGQLGIYPQ